MTDAASIARALGGKRNSDGFLCRCPVPSHGKRRGDRNPSLSVRDGDTALLVHCFGNCDPLDVLDALRRRGLIEERDDDRPAPRYEAPTPPPHEPDPDALEIWTAASAVPGSIVETYLRSRGITLDVPPSLRCDSILRLGRYPMPRMVAAVQRSDGKIVSVQTTLLTPAGKKAAVWKPRLITGKLGTNAVRLAEATDVLGLAEGVETALSAMQLSGVPCWACLGLRMKSVTVPDGIRELHLFGDNDEASRGAVDRAAAEHRHRRVVFRFPADGYGDWNDLLRAQCESAA
jgi:hypothetical protein